MIISKIILQIGNSTNNASMLIWLLVTMILFAIVFLSVQKFKKIITPKSEYLAIVGVFLGIPFSYYFQSERIKYAVDGISGYLQHFNLILEDQNYFGNLLLSVIIFTLLGALIGYFIDKIEKK
jgi:ACR3 family arsenite efflux pump ArsB